MSDLLLDGRLFLPDFVYGSIDGTITTFAVVSGTAGAALSTNVIIILGIANVIADGFSMAMGRYLSARAEEETTNSKRLISPMTSAVVTFLSFVVMGMIPLVAFIYAYLAKKSGNMMYNMSYGLTALSLFLIGYIKGNMLGWNPIYKGFETLSMGGIAAIISFSIGRFLRNIK